MSTNTNTNKSKLKFGTRIAMAVSIDVWGATQVTQELTIYQLEPTRIVGYESCFEMRRLIDVVMTQEGIARVGQSGARLGLEPYAFPSSFYDKRDARDLWLNQWTPRPRIVVNCRNLFDEGAAEAMMLLCKAQEFTVSGWNQLHKPKYAPLMGDDYIWGNLDIFTRLMLGLHSQGVKMIEGALQDYQSISDFQFDSAWIRHMWDTSQMLRGLSEVELKEGALSA